MEALCVLLVRSDPPPAVFVEAATNAAARKQEALNFLASGVCRVLWKCEGTEDWKHFESLHGYLRDAILLGAVELDDSDKRMLNDYTNRLGALIDQPLESRDVPADPKPGDRPHCDPREFNECDACYFRETGPRCQGCQSNELLITRLRSENTANRLLVKMFQEKCEPDKPDAMQEADLIERRDPGPPSVEQHLYDACGAMLNLVWQASKHYRSTDEQNAIEQAEAAMVAANPNWTPPPHQKEPEPLPERAGFRDKEYLHWKKAVGCPEGRGLVNWVNELREKAQAGPGTAMQEAIDAGLFEDNDELNRTPADISRSSAGVWSVNFRIGQGCAVLGAMSPSLAEALRGAVVKMKTADRLERKALERERRAKVVEPTPPEPEYTTVNGELTPEALAKEPTPADDAETAVVVRQNITCDLWHNDSKAPAWTISETYDTGRVTTFHVSADEGLGAWWNRLGTRVAPGQRLKPMPKPKPADQPTPAQDAEMLRKIAADRWNSSFSDPGIYLGIAERLEKPVDQDVAAARDRFNANIEAWRKAAGCPDGVYLTGWLEKLCEKAKNSIPLPEGAFVRTIGEGGAWYRVEDGLLRAGNPYPHD